MTQLATRPIEALEKPREERNRSAGSTRRRLLRVLLHVVVIVFMVIWFTPILGLFVTSLRTPADIAGNGWWNAVLSPLLTGYNYQRALSVVGVGDSLLTSLAIALPTTIITTVISAIGAFALTRMSFVGRTLVSLVLVAMLVVPPQVTLVPLLRLYSDIGLQGAIPGVWIYQVGFTVPFGVFLIRGFIAAMPEEIFEAASLDGATLFRSFTAIVIPLALPVLASLAILQFMWSWNDLLIPLLFLGGSDVPAPITVAVAGLVQSNGQNENLLMAATFISVLPPLIVLIALQRYFVRGVLGGAVK